MGTRGARNHLARFAQHPGFVALRDVWDAHATGSGVSADACEAAKAAPAHSAELYFSLIALPCEQLALGRLTAADRARLADLGMDVEGFSEFLEEFLAPGSSLLTRRLGRGEPWQAEIRLRSERLAGYKHRIVREGRLRLPDPFGEEVLEPFDSVKFFGRTLYAFQGRRLFYLVCGSMGSDALGIHVPALNLSLSFLDRKVGPLWGPGLASVQAQLTLRLCRRRVEFEEAEKGRRPRHRGRSF